MTTLHRLAEVIRDLEKVKLVEPNDELYVFWDEKSAGKPCEFCVNIVFALAESNYTKTRSNAIIKSFRSEFTAHDIVECFEDNGQKKPKSCQVTIWVR